MLVGLLKNQIIVIGSLFNSTTLSSLVVEIPLIRYPQSDTLNQTPIHPFYLSNSVKTRFNEACLSGSAIAKVIWHFPLISAIDLFILILE